MKEELKEFTVEVYEIHTQLYKVNAKDWKDAIKQHEIGLSSEVETGHDFLETDEEMGYHSIRSIEDEEGNKVTWEFIKEEMK